MTEETIVIQQKELDISQELQKNTIYNVEFFTKLVLKCVYTTTSDSQFPILFQSAKLDPLVSFHFVNSISGASFFIICTENLCLVVEIDNKDILSTEMKRLIHKSLFPSTEGSNDSNKPSKENRSSNDIEELKKHIDIKAVTLPDKNDLKNIYYDTHVAINIFKPYFTSTFDEKWTLNRFLFLAIYPIITYGIRRFFFTSDSFADPSFFKFKYIDDQYQSFQKDEFLSIRVIGNGSYGTVSIGMHRETGYLVALKTMQSNKAKKKSDSLRIRFLYESLFYKKYRHPSILRGYGMYEEGSSMTVIVTDYMCNGSLEEYVRDQSLDPTSKTKAVLQILFGIDYLHSKGLMHCDLKPGNILISHDNDFYICDFDSTCRYVSEKKRKQVAVGTHNYTAPEVVRGEEYSFQIDLYSFGIIIYELATGKNPFENLSYLDGVNMVAEGKISQLSQNYGLIYKLFQRCSEHLREARANSFYLLHMCCSEKLFFLNSDIKYIIQKIEEIKQRKQPESEGLDRQDIQFILEEAELGKVYAEFNLAVLYHNAWAVKKDYEKAYELFMRAAAKNHASANYNIGNMNFWGRGIPKDMVLAFIYYSKAADLDFTEAFNGIGNMYKAGVVPILKEKADGEFEAEKDDKGNTLFYPPNYQKAFENYTIAADRGYSYSICNIGDLYVSGHLGDPDYEKAAEYYRRAAALSNLDAEFILGTWYYQGQIGGAPNMSQALDYFEQSSSNDHPEAHFKVAEMYRDGIGTEKNTEKAAEYFLKAAEANNGLGSRKLMKKESLVELAKIHLDGQIAQHSDEMAANYLTDAVEKPDNKPDDGKVRNIAKVMLAKLCLDGRGIAKDIERAKVLLQQAADDGNEDAKNELQNILGSS